MTNIVSKLKGLSALACGLALLASCGGGKRPDAVNPGQSSTATGLEYNEDGGFAVNDFRGQPAGPNLVFIQGGRTTLGSYEEDILNTRDNLERTVTVASFYMDETEVANIHWLEYLFYVKLDSSREFYESALPDTTVWARELAFNDPYVEHYLRYPGFRYHPVVGVTWVQANDYCKWRTRVVNQKLAEDNGLDDVPETSGGRIPLETGVVLPDYRLPTEAEWEYAAQALIGTQWLDENQTHKRLYPWDGHALRNPYGKQMGYFLANFKRGRGDYAGIAGKLNDGAMITAYIYEFPPNDFGLYNMAGNVNEWVQDVYRPLSFREFDDLNPVRRDGWLDEESNYDQENSMVNDRARVYKGGSWKDIAYWLSPGTRRYLEEDSATATIGFRCAMISAGTNY
ncbi:gliding motility lipoprotein GldJ [Cesiribacter andamanensis]|uniref:Serine/threonine-protein kinase pkn1 n=1 Tax=Cesiribacter andamanensis AMV16 TaxID=1279009 RepID=M7N6I9_9BACT|nr:gliding motility lipoprotein GldJ [Cesiribacter andamanensis]EMR02897.1 Serine/threonine-protein kinase pkn1 [Cesiribacter andamanensis AMV16]